MTTPHLDLLPELPPEIASGLVFLSDEARGMGVRVVASRGAGKSRLLGRTVAWCDFVRGTPLCVFDPVGGVIDNVLDKLVRLPKRDQERLWPRVRYVDLAGQHGYVVPMPLYYRTGDESLYQIAQRPLDVWRKADPALQGASILGYNALAAIGTRVGMALAATGGQITEAESLLDRPLAWEPRLRAAAVRNPDLTPVVDYFGRTYPGLSAREREQQTLSFRRKLAPFLLDPALGATYGADRPGIDWQEAVDGRLCVLLDGRHLLDHERKRWALLWLEQHLLEWIKRRGPGRHRPLSLVIDELTYLLGDPHARADPLADDLEELVARLARNHAIWLTVAHQEVNQLSDRVNFLLMTCNQIFGSTADVEAALAIARRFDRWDPMWEKKRDKVWANDRLDGHFVIDERSTEYTIPEQEYLNSRKYLELPRFAFLVGLSPSEGTLPTRLRRISIAGFDAGLYVQEELVSEARRRLAQRDGVAVGELGAAIAARAGRSGDQPGRDAKASRVPGEGENDGEPRRPSASRRREPI